MFDPLRGYHFVLWPIGGIGRHAGLRNQCASVGVQVSHRLPFDLFLIYLSVAGNRCGSGLEPERCRRKSCHSDHFLERYDMKDDGKESEKIGGPWCLTASIPGF